MKPRLFELSVTTRPLQALKPHPHNARTHSPKQRRAIAASIRRFGFVNPVLIDKDDVIIAGHGRVMAARELGLEQVPVICIEHKSDDEPRAYIIADNKLAEMAGWDRDILATELQHLIAIDITLPEIIGFEVGEIEVILDEADGASDPDDEDVPEPQQQALSRLGDHWILGDRHSVMCGDARDGAALERLMAGEKADAVFVDVPYNLVVAKVVGSGKTQHREFAMGSGEMSVASFTALQRPGPV